MKKIFLFLLFLVFISVKSYAFTNSEMFIDTNSAFIDLVQGKLDQNIGVVLSPASLSEVARFLTKTLQIRFLASASIKDRKVDIVQDNISIRNLLKKIQRQANVFFVYRPGYILITDRAKFLINLRSELNKDQMIDLEKKIFGTQSEIFLSKDKALAVLDIIGLTKFRDFLLETNLSSEIERTDLVVEPNLLQ